MTVRDVLKVSYFLHYYGIKVLWSYKHEILVRLNNAGFTTEGYADELCLIIQLFRLMYELEYLTNITNLWMI